MENNYGEYTQGYINEGFSVTTEQEIKCNTGNEITWEQYRATLKNKLNKTLETSRSSVSLEKALLGLEKNAEKRRKKELEKRRPFAELKFKINNITDTMFNNNDKAKPHSRNVTFHGWDIMQHTSGVAEITIHNAGNYVMSFNMFDERDLRRVEVNLHCLRLESSFRGKNEMEALPHLLNAIDEYLDIPLADRKAEFEGDK